MKYSIVYVNFIVYLKNYMVIVQFFILLSQYTFMSTIKIITENRYKHTYQRLTG